MGNYVFCIMEVAGNKKELKRFQKGIRNNCIIESYLPEPQELLDSKNNFFESIFKSEQEYTCLDEENKRKYGYSNVFEWRKDHWGSYSSDMNTALVKKGRNQLFYSFMCKWTVPFYGLVEISTLFPELTFSFRYVFEEDVEPYQGIVYRNGNLDTTQCGEAFPYETYLSWWTKCKQRVFRFRRSTKFKIETFFTRVGLINRETYEFPPSE